MSLRAKEQTIHKKTDVCGKLTGKQTDKNRNKKVLQQRIKKQSTIKKLNNRTTKQSKPESNPTIKSREQSNNQKHWTIKQSKHNKIKQ